MRKGGQRLDVAYGVIGVILLIVSCYVIIAWKVNLNKGRNFYAPSPVSIQGRTRSAKLLANGTYHFSVLVLDWRSIQHRTTRDGIFLALARPICLHLGLHTAILLEQRVYYSR
jgi:hypothetical protein